MSGVHMKRLSDIGAAGFSADTLERSGLPAGGHAIVPRRRKRHHHMSPNAWQHLDIRHSRVAKAAPDEERNSR